MKASVNGSSNGFDTKRLVSKKSKTLHAGIELTFEKL